MLRVFTCKFSEKTNYGSVGYQLKDKFGNNYGRRKTKNIYFHTEGRYEALIDLPDDFEGFIVWDSGGNPVSYSLWEIPPLKPENTDVRILSRTEHADLATQMKEIARQVSDGPKNQTTNIFYESVSSSNIQTGNNPVSIQHQPSGKSIDKKANKKIGFMERFQKVGKLVGVIKIIWDFFKSIFY